MTRTDAEAEREALKQEIKSELKKDAAKRRIAGFAGCAVLMLAILAVPFILLLSTMAKTGFVDVPLFSAWLYGPSEPVRTVHPLAGSTSEQVMQAVTSKISYDRDLGTITMMASDTQLTTLAQALLKDKGYLPFRASSVQVAVDPAFIEIYFVSVRSKRNATVRVRFTPNVRDGVLSFDANEVLIGSLRVPKFMAQYVLGVYGAETKKVMQDFSSEIGELRRIELKEGQMSVIIRPVTR